MASPAEVEDPAEVAWLEDKAVAVRRLAEQVKARRLAAVSPRVQAGEKGAREEYDTLSKYGPSEAADEMAQHLEASGNGEAAAKYKKLSAFISKQGAEDQALATNEQFAKTNNTVLGYASRAAALVGAAGDAMDVVGLGKHIIKPAVMKAQEALGGPAFEQAQGSQAALEEDVAKTDVGHIGLGAEKAVGTVAALGATTGALGTLAKALPQVGKLGALAKVLGAEPVAMWLGAMANRVGEGGAAAIADAMYGESAHRESGAHIFGTLDEAAKDNLLMSAIAPVAGFVGARVARGLASLAPASSRMAAVVNRLAGGAGGLIGYLPYTLQHPKTWRDAFSSDPAVRREARLELIGSAITFSALGALHPQTGPGFERATAADVRGDGNRTIAEALAQREKTLGRGMSAPSSVAGAPRLPTEVQIAIRTNVRDAFEKILKSADGDERVTMDLLNAVRAREMLGYEKPGTFERIADMAQKEMGAKHLVERHEAIAEEQKKTAEKIDKMSPTDAGFPVEPGMGVDTQKKAEMLGQLFATEAAAGKPSPFRATAFPGGTQRDIADTGKKLKINVSADKREPKWEHAEVIGRSFFSTGKNQGRLKAVHVRFGNLGQEGWFDATHIRKGLVIDAADATPKPTESARDAKGQRKLKLKEEPKPKAPAEAEAAADKAVAAVPAAKIEAAKGAAPKTEEKRVATPQERSFVDALGKKQADLRKAKRELETDPRTGLGSKRVFESMKDAVDKNPKRRWLMMDARDFGEFNTKMGQKAGDEAIEKMGALFKRIAVEEGVPEASITSPAGDEFFAAEKEGMDPKDFERIAARLNEAAIRVRGKRIKFRAVVGDTYEKVGVAKGEMKAAEIEAKKPKEKEAKSAPEDKAASKGPALPSDFVEKQRSVRAKAKEARAGTLNAKVAVAREALKGSGIDPEKVTHETLWHAQIARTKVYGEAGWRKVRWQDVVDARASGDADRIEWAERAAKLANVTEPKKQEPTPAAEGSPSPEPEGAPTPASEAPPVHEEAAALTGEQIVDRAISRARIDLATSAAAYAQEAKREGREVTPQQLARLESQKKAIKDFEKLSRMAKKKAKKKAATPIPEAGDSVVVRTDDGQEVVGVVKEADADARRMVVVKESGASVRVRLSDVVDIAPMDVMSADFSKAKLVSRDTLMSLMTGRRALDTPGYRAGVKLRSDFSDDPRSKGAERRRAILAGAATPEQASREAASRARRVAYGELKADDYEIEARAFLAPPSARNVVKARTAPDTKGRDALEQTRSPKAVAEAKILSHETHPIHWFDPDAKLRTESDLAELAKHSSKEGEAAALDLSNYLHFKQKADFERTREQISDTLDASTRRLGRGFAVISGDVEELDKGGLVFVRQQAIDENNEYGDPKILVLGAAGDSGNFAIRELTTKETLEAYHRDPKIREAMQRHTADRHAERTARLDDEKRMQIVEFAAVRSKAALDEIEAFIYGDRDKLPPGELFDMARAWAKANPRPEPGTKEDKAWEELAIEQLDPFGRGESTIGDRATTLVRAFRDPVTGDPLEWKPTENGGEVGPVAGSRITLLSVLPGVPPPGTWRRVKQVGGAADKAMHAVTDVAEVLADATLDPIRDLLFRPETTGLADAYGEKAWFKRWGHIGRKAEALTPWGAEGESEARTILNQHEGFGEALEERAIEALRRMQEIGGERMVSSVRAHTMGKDVKGMEGVRDLFDDLLEAFKAEGELDGSSADRFKGRYVPYNKFEWTAAEIAARRKALEKDRRALAADNASTKGIDEKLEMLDEIVAKHGSTLSPSRIVVGPVSLREYRDSDSAALWRKGYLKRRGFESFDDAVKAGLSISNLVDNVRQGLFDEISYLKRLRLFKALASNPRMVMDADKAPSHWVRVDKANTSGHNVWDLLDGKKVMPYVLDQLYNADPRYDPVKYWMNYAHLAMKAGATMVNPSFYINNLIGNPGIMLFAKMPMWKLPIYVKNLLHLYAADPLRPKWMQDLARKGGVGSRRDFYVKQGWINRTTDLTREADAIASDRHIEAYARNGFEVQDRDADEKAFHRLVGGAVTAGKWSYARIRHLAGLLDASARVTLFEHNQANGMGEKENVNQVNDWFDVQHLGKLGRAMRSGPVALLPGVAAMSFTSYNVAMARNAKRVLTAGPMAWAQVAALAYGVRLAVGAMYGKSDDEMSDIVDASTPRTGSRFFDRLNRSTAMTVPTTDGPKVWSTVKYSPHDAVLDLIPGVRPAVMGGYDEMGRTPKGALYDYLGRSVLTGTYAEWFLDHSNVTGTTVQDRYDGLWDYLRQRQGLPIPLPFAQFVARFMVKGDAMRRADGVHGSQAILRATRFSPGRRDASDASVSKFSEQDAWTQLFGIRLQTPNAIKRFEEDARNSGLVHKKDGDWIPDVEPDSPGRDEARALAKKLNLADDFMRGMRLSESLIWLGKATADGDTEQIDELKKVISKMAPTDSSYKSAIKALVWYNERARAFDVAQLGFKLGVRPHRERRIQKGGGDVTLPSDDE